MAIKPKSRAHEDRIRALEDKTTALIACYHGQQEIINRLQVALYVERRPWYKRMLGL